MNIDATQTHFLRYICTTVGVTAVKSLSGPDLGSVLTLSMVLELMLRQGSSDDMFSSIKEEFSSLTFPPNSNVKKLFLLLFSVCDLACVFDKQQADDLISSLIFLSPVSSSN